MEMLSIETSSAQSVTPAYLSDKPAISIVGLGYVGAVSTACLSKLGHRVVGVDLDHRKVDQINKGISPIHEKDLGQYLAQGVSAGRISATDDLAAAVRETDVTFVSVGTPTAEGGGCDYSYIEGAARSMAVGLAQKDGFHVFAMRCSIPPGTTMKVMTPILEMLSGKVAGRDFGVCFNPEFLREGVAISDFHAPPKTVIGTTDLHTAQIMSRIYEPVDANPIITSIETAEMVKYVDNVWHATKVCFANEIGRLCKPMGVDSHDVMDVFVQDTKLNLSPYYLKPGFAYGGSCLPKEVRAVAHLAENAGVDLPLISNLANSNQEHINQAIRMVRATGSKKVGVLGLAFKPGTDDLRESPVLEVLAALQKENYEIRAYDEAINSETALLAQVPYIKHASPGLKSLVGNLPYFLCDDIEDVLANSDILLIAHDTPQYRQLAHRCTEHHIVDLARVSEPMPEQERYQGIAW